MMKIFGKEYELINPSTYEVESKQVGDKLYIYDPTAKIILRFTKIAENTWEPNILFKDGEIMSNYDVGLELDDVELTQDWVDKAIDKNVYILDTPAISEAF